ncbi:MAG: hypothetical protein AAGF15_09455 [Pseudomonadota bacterium]
MTETAQRREVINRGALEAELRQMLEGADDVLARRKLLVDRLGRALVHGRREIDRRADEQHRNGKQLAKSQSYLIDQLLLETSSPPIQTPTRREDQWAAGDYIFVARIFLKVTGRLPEVAVLLPH